MGFAAEDYGYENLYEIRVINEEKQTYLTADTNRLTRDCHQPLSHPALVLLTPRNNSY